VTAVADPRASGERLEALLEASAAAGPLVHERAEELVRIVVDLYGAGLERLLELANEQGCLSDGLLEALAQDELVSGLLVVHGLHPYGVEDRVLRALEEVRPYLGSHGGDVKLLEVTHEGVVRLQLLGSCDGCASSAVTLELAVEDAIRAAAPEVTRLEVEEPLRGVIPVASLSSRLRTSWTPTESLDVGALRRTKVGGRELVVIRLTSGYYAYQDRCAGCALPFEGAVLERTPVSAVLTCGSCRARFDVRQAGVDVDRPDRHLVPVPLLDREGVVEVAVPA
jgi:Fe-S cluster biogenesis protein NfuA/nitrite reductase/ring-hydroxylating ferredoxin subunit